MKTSRFFLIVRLLLFSYSLCAQEQPASQPVKPFTQWSIEPAIGIHTNMGTDLLLTNMFQWNPMRRLSVVAHSSYDINNITARDFNHIKTEYNYSFNQKFGIGTTFYGKRTRHSFFLMAGAKYTAFKETLDNSDFDKVDVTISRWSPDYGMMYCYKRDVKRVYFTARVYIPLYPWPIKSADINTADANMWNVALEFGVGIKLK